MTSRDEQPAADPKPIEIRYYAILREHMGRSSESLHTAAVTARDLFAELQARHQWPWDRAAFRVAVNDELRDWSAPVQAGDIISILPPVAGG